MAKIFIRNISFRKLVDNFFVSAVGSVLIVRAFLFLTGYPSLGGDRLHIAHMLWGGLCMAAAIVLLLTFLGRRVQYIAAIIGGVGFGLFIDELGKFITRDNNYFFQPAVMLIYIIFVGFYFIIRELDKTITLSEGERVINALELSKEMMVDHFDEDERSALLRLMELPSHHEPLFVQLRKILVATGISNPAQWHVVIKNIRRVYFAFAHSRFIVPLVIALSILQGLLITFSFQDFLSYTDLHFLEQTIVVIGICFAVISALYVIASLYQLSHNRVVAYRKLYRANLTSVLLVQPFAFYVATFIPILALVINLAGMFTLQYLIELENRKTTAIS